jgi:N-methylhydantoinase A
MQQAMVPIHAGVLSALGMLVAPRSRQLSRTRIAPLVSMPHEQIDAVYAELEAQGRQELIAEGVAGAEIEVRRSLDLRYEGQSYYLNLPWNDISSCEVAFHRLHAERYGHELDLPVELVNLRVGLASRPTPLVLTSLSVEASSSAYDQVSLYGVEQPAAVYARAGLVAGQQLTGPALITETISTTYLAPNWRCDVDSAGNLLLSYQAE